MVAGGRWRPALMYLDVWRPQQCVLAAVPQFVWSLPHDMLPAVLQLDSMHGNQVVWSLAIKFPVCSSLRLTHPTGSYMHTTCGSEHVPVL